MGNHVVVGVSQNAGVLVVLVVNKLCVCVCSAYTPGDLVFNVLQARL